MEKIPCTVGILTFNSAATLGRALESVRDFDDIVVCDGGSTDATLDLARASGARIIAQDPAFKNPDGTLRDYSGVRNQCVEAAKYDWFLYIDSDETAEPALVEEVRGIVTAAQPPHLIYNISPRIVLDGRRIDHSSNYPGWQKRFFNRATGARFRKAVHERITYDEARYPAGYMNAHWYYYITSTPDDARTRRYAQMDAALYSTTGTGRFLFLATRKLATIARILVRASLNSLFHPRTSLPFALEMTRVHYQANIVRQLLAGYLGRFSSKPNTV